MQLTDVHRDILDFERSRWKYAGAKEAEVRRRFGVSLVRYHQMLTWAIDQPEALAYAPALVRRLQRLREIRGRQRASRRGSLMLATEP
jgi:hypothetical protein